MNDNAEETAWALRCKKISGGLYCPREECGYCRMMPNGDVECLASKSDFYDKCADLIESLQAQLVESQRRERAAVEELNGILGQIDEDEYLRKAFCVHPGNEDCPSEKENGYVDVDDCVGCPLFKNSWHGPQEEKGEAE